MEPRCRHCRVFGHYDIHEGLADGSHGRVVQEDSLFWWSSTEENYSFHGDGGLDCHGGIDNHCQHHHDSPPRLGEHYHQERAFVGGRSLVDRFR